MSCNVENANMLAMSRMLFGKMKIYKRNESTEVQTLSAIRIELYHQCFEQVYSNIISHQSLVFEVDTTAIDLRRSAHRSSRISSKVDTSIIDPRRSTHRSSIFESRYIDLRRATHRYAKIEGGNIAPTFRQLVTKYCPQRAP